MDTDGTNQRNLTRNPALRDGWYGPSWSPDGTSILYPSEAETPPEPVVDLRQALGAASILIQAALLACVALVALRHGPLPFGALTLLMFGPTVLMTVVSDEYRFLPGTLVAGIVVDLLVRRLRDGTSRRSAAAIAFAIPATFYGAYFVTLQLTGGIGWTIHLWLGAIILAGVVGILLDLAGRGTRPAPTA
jgi:hypothetical protein